jgi:hypothetical protein
MAKDEGQTTKNHEPRTAFFPILLRYQGEMRQWRLVRLVRHFFLSQVESDNYAVEKNAKFREFPKSVTFLYTFPFWNYKGGSRVRKR